MRVLVTGSSGFVGRHVVKELEGDHELLTPSRMELDLLRMGDFEENGVSEYLNQQKPDAIVHLAATVAGLPGNLGNQGKFMYDNLQMALNIFEAARFADVKKVVNLGSVCGYHDIGPKPFKEENYWTGLPHESNRGYGMAKRASIMLGIEYARQYGLNVTNLIPINLVGEFDTSDHVIIDLIRKFENPSCKMSLDKPFVRLWGTGSATREFCYAGDLAEAIAISLETETDAWPINIGTGEEISIKQLAEMIKLIGQYNVHIWWDEDKPEGQASRCLDIARAKEVLGWSPKTTLQEAIRRTINWYRSECLR